MSADWIITEQHGRVGLIRLHRPQALNALNESLMQSLSQALLAFEAQADIHVMVITGSEKAFAAGADIVAMKDWDYAHVHLHNYTGGLWQTLIQLRKPVIAAVSGYALGGGCELAMMCDTIYASETAQFAQPEIKLGTIPGLGGTQRLTRAIGKAKAMDWVLTGRRLTAEQAEAAGLVARVLPQEGFVEAVIHIAQEIAAYSLPVLMLAKQSVNAALETTLSQGLQQERQAFHATFALQDQKEGMNAFVQKRAPQFKNA